VCKTEFSRYTSSRKVDPGPADEDDFAVLGEIGPGERSIEFVCRYGYAAECAADETMFSAGLLNERLAVERLFDAALGVFFGSDLVDDEPTLVGELHSFSHAVGDVEIACLFIKCTAEAGGVIGVVAGRDGEVVAAGPSEIRGPAVDDACEPRGFEKAALGRCRVLLAEGGKALRAEAALDLIVDN
jgi:hypothetical protein